jgi:hypothetical protein
MADYPIDARVRIGQCEGTVRGSHLIVQLDGVGAPCYVDRKFADLVGEPQPVVDSELRDLAALIQQELELAQSGEGYEPQAVAEEIVRTRVAPVLAARDEQTLEIARLVGTSVDKDGLTHEAIVKGLRFLHESRDEYKHALANGIAVDLATADANFREIRLRLAEMIDADEEAAIPDLLTKVNAELDLRWATRQQYAEERDQALARIESVRLECARIGTELQRERESRQDWAAEAMRLDAELARARYERSGVEVGQPDTEATAEQAPFQAGQLVRREDGDTFTVGGVEKCGNDWKVYDAHTVFAFYQWASNLELADAIPVDTEATEQGDPLVPIGPVLAAKLLGADVPATPTEPRKRKDCFHPWPGCNCPWVVEDGTQ